MPKTRSSRQSLFGKGRRFLLLFLNMQEKNGCNKNPAPVSNAEPFVYIN